jgi:GNAT superfamily N-acetyltransferase
MPLHDTETGRHGKDLKHRPQPGVTFRLMGEGEVRAVCGLVHRVFNLSVAPLYTEKGRRSFKDYADPEELSARINSDHFVLVALAEDDIVGMIEVRRNSHIALFFIAPEHQGAGIGNKLLEKALKRACAENPRLRELTVNSSPNAVAAYERMGFASSGPEQDINGVRSVPMKRVL